MTALPTFPRDMLATVFNGNQRMIGAFESLIDALTSVVNQAGAGDDARTVLDTAGFLLASANAALPTSRILTEGAGIDLIDDGSGIVVSVSEAVPQIVGGQSVRFITTGPTSLILPPIGQLATIEDVAAAAGTGVTSFNTRHGAVVLTGADVTGALTYTPTSVTGLTGVQSVAGFKTGLSLVKGDVGLGNVDNTADAAKAVLSATKLATARNINGVAFDGTGAITVNLSAARTIAMSGDVVWSVSFDGSAAVTAAGTIQAGAITLAKMANMATASVFYRKTAGTGAPEVQTLATLKTDLGLTGTNSGDQTITLTGDVTGSGAGSFAATIANGAVTLAKQANMATASVVYRKTAGSGAPEVQTLATLKTDLGLTGTNSGDQTITATGDVTGSGTGSFALTIANDAVTYAKMQNVSATSRILGRITAGAGDPEELTPANVKTILALAQADITGLTTADSPSFVATTSSAAAGVPNLQTSQNTGSIADSGTYDFAAQTYGMFFIAETAATGQMALCVTDGVSVRIIYQSGSLYTTTINTASKVNLYYNSTTPRIQNKAGAPCTFRIIDLKAG